MAYKTLYRVYRPQRFEDVAGQEHIITTLRHAVEENKIAHAYLFCGPRGTGKRQLLNYLLRQLTVLVISNHVMNVRIVKKLL